MWTTRLYCKIISSRIKYPYYLRAIIAQAFIAKVEDLFTVRPFWFLETHLFKSGTRAPLLIHYRRDPTVLVVSLGVRCSVKLNIITVIIKRFQSCSKYSYLQTSSKLIDIVTRVVLFIFHRAIIKAVGTPILMLLMYFTCCTHNMS